MNKFEYTFDNLALLINEFVEKLKLEKFSIYVHDYGSPIGFQLATKHPERIQAVITQNGNAYEEGLTSAWDSMRKYWGNSTEENKIPIKELLTAEFTKHQYINGTRNPNKISPDTWNLDQTVLDRPGNEEIQLALFYDYRNNLKQYSEWQTFFRTYQPPTFVAWGKMICSFVLWTKRSVSLPECSQRLRVTFIKYRAFFFRRIKNQCISD